MKKEEVPTSGNVFYFAQIKNNFVGTITGSYVRDKKLLKLLLSQQKTHFCNRKMSEKKKAFSIKLRPNCLADGRLGE